MEDFMKSKMMTKCKWKLSSLLSREPLQVASRKHTLAESECVWFWCEMRLVFSVCLISDIDLGCRQTKNPAKSEFLCLEALIAAGNGFSCRRNAKRMVGLYSEFLPAHENSV